jgi:hypothetical protein
MLLVFFSCSNNNNEAATTSVETSTAPKENTKAEATQGDGMVGKWELIGFVQDTNDNLQVDEDERKNLKAASYKDYMTLNSDGSGLFTVAEMEGRYEIEDKDGKKFLRWFDKANGPHRIGTILKVSKEELHIKEPGGNGMFVWKRI